MNSFYSKITPATVTGLILLGLELIVMDCMGPLRTVQIVGIFILKSPDFLLQKGGIIYPKNDHSSCCIAVALCMDHRHQVERSRTS